MTIFLFVGTITLLAVAGYVWWQTRAAEGVVMSAWCCPHCDRRLRYPSTRAGRTACCPACKRRLTLPTAVSVAGSVAPTYSLKRRVCASTAPAR
jgi:hypothetical protein